jgi:hypothetical protein
MFQPYEPRTVTFLGVEAWAGHRIKVYAIRYGEGPFETARFDEGCKLAKSALPMPAVASGRPGVGFVILHQGRGADYVILCWWDRENELPTRIFVREPEGWRAAKEGESFCVWDLHVIWAEREAYVRTVLAGRADGVEAYLATAASGQA